jgi:hypothetical protein
MEREELRHDRHTVSLLTDHMVFSPMCWGKILAGDVALALDGIIRKTCKDLNIEQENKREEPQRIAQSVSTSQGMV